MVNYTYTKEYWPDYNAGSSLEWCITNGLGSYGGGSLIGSLARTHHGYLAASLNSPTDRYIVLDQVIEQVDVQGKLYDLESSVHLINGKSVYKNGQDYLSKVSYDGTIEFTYECGELTSVSEEGESIVIPAFTCVKTIALARKTNTLVISYELTNNTDLVLTIALTPLFNFREHNTLTDEELPKFREQRTGRTLSLVPRTNLNTRIDFSVSDGTFIQKVNKIDFNSQLQKETNSGTSALCSHYTPYQIDISIPPHKTHAVSVVCHVEYSEWMEGDALLQQAGDMFIKANTARKVIESVRKRTQALIDQAGYNDDYADKLVLAADHFISYRASTDSRTILAGLPLYADRGRDALIAFTGLTLYTRRYSDATQILKSYTRYIHNGMIPNILPDSAGDDPVYNSADAALWYFIAVYNYLTALRDDNRVDDRTLEKSANFVHNSIFPVLATIIESYEHGTDHSIYMEQNGLLHAGDQSDQVTWMNVSVEGNPVTPRQGCPVELNALWYNALCIMDYMCRIFGYDDGGHYMSLADSVKASFVKSFWNPAHRCLYDVVEFDPETGEIAFRDEAIRPNQIYAVSLPFSLLSIREEKAIVETVERHLYIGCGIRSLSKAHPDYKGMYSGPERVRAASYHQGTAWAYPLGAFITAYRKVNGPGSDTTARIYRLLEPVLAHISEADCVGGISEIFEGDEPHNGCGCYTHACSVGEILRAYTDTIYSKQPR